MGCLLLVSSCGTESTERSATAERPPSVFEAREDAQPHEGIRGHRRSRDSPFANIADGTAVIHHADPTQQAMVAWSIGRFEESGLERPDFSSITFPSPTSCQHAFAGKTLSRQGVVDIEICFTAEQTEERPATVRNVILHELAHAWMLEHVTDSAERAFIAEFQLERWSSAELRHENGSEYAAEIIAWALMDQLVTPRVSDTSCDQLLAAYELLTGATASWRSADCTEKGIHFERLGLRGRIAGLERANATEGPTLR